MSHSTLAASQEVEQALIPAEPKQTATIHVLFDKCDEIFEQHRQENPDLYGKIKQNKKIAALSLSAVADGTAVKKGCVARISQSWNSVGLSNSRHN